jgi:hypothetical protein
LGDRSAISHLEVLLDDEVQAVRVLAKLAIGRIEDYEGEED